MSALFSNSFIWSIWFRFFIFWMISISASYLSITYFGYLTTDQMIDVLLGPYDANFVATVSSRPFAFTLAIALGGLAFGMCIAHLILDCILVVLSIRAARLQFERSDPSSSFADDRDRVRLALAENPIVGHGWGEFDETLVVQNDRVYNTMRPQAFFTLAAVREKVSGLKWQSVEPGYFVGLGLLLTFIGLVIALSKAAGATAEVSGGAAAAGQGATAMQGALRDLLQAATFKFSTSIAGLGASIFLSIFYRAFTIGIESSLHSFCEAVEKRMNYLPPQSVSVEMRDHLAGQLTQLKEINSEVFFNKLGAQVAPSMEQAVVRAVTPLTDQIGIAMQQLNATSQTGVQQLITQFTENLQGGAGTEMRALTAGLQTVIAALDQTRSDVGRSGEDFSARMAEAANNLNRLVTEAAQNLNEQSQSSQQTLNDMMKSLQDLFEQASQKIDTQLGDAANGASGRLMAAMDGVLQQLDQRIRALGERFEKLSETIGEQARALDAITAQSREAATAFGQSADAVRGAIEPVTRSNERLAAATTAFGASLTQAGSALDDGQKAARELTESISAQVQRLTTLWGDYQRRFGEVDEKLGRAFERLGEETNKQSQILAKGTGAVDKALAEAIDKLNPAVQGISDGAQELADTVEELKKIFQQRPINR